MDDLPLFSVIIPVKNEAAVLGRCLTSLAGLNYPRERLEVIIVDGLSTDNTREVAAGFQVKVLDNPGQIVVSGRNRGYQDAKGEFIVFTDADCTFDKDWLRKSLKYFKDESVAGVGGVSLIPADSTGFEKAADFIFRLADFFNLTSHRHKSHFSKEVSDIPGCNAIYRRQALEKVMPVDEGLLTAEDTWMNFRIRSFGYKLIAAGDVIIWHYRRSSPKKFLRQMYRFAIGRLQAAKRDIRLLNPLHASMGLALPIFILAGIFFSKAVLVFLAAIAVFCLIRTKSLAAAASMPLAAVIFISGWSAGFLRELFFPLRDAKGK